MPAIITLLVNFRVCKSQKMAQSLLPLDPRPCVATHYNKDENLLLSKTTIRLMSRSS